MTDIDESTINSIYPGTFDPLTNGHIDLIKRACSIFGHVLVGVATRPDKNTLFSIEERVAMIEEALVNDNRVIVKPFDGLLVEYMKRQGANVIIRGIRVLSDFEYEFQMALMNKRLDPLIETFFLVPDETYTYLSSRLVKEVAFLGGSVRELVPPNVEKRLLEKVKNRR